MTAAPPLPRCGAIVLCGGRSLRMGTSKALLPFGPEAMLRRVVRIVREAVAGPIVVVAAADQPLPPLDADVALVRDARPDRGPLEGLAAGLRALASSRTVHGVVELAFVTTCDAPLLRPEFIAGLCARLGPADDAAAPHVAGFLYPLSTVYRTATVLPHVERLLAVDKLRATSLLTEVRTRVIEEADLRTFDPDLGSLRNVNTMDEYQAALGDAGFAT